MPTKPTVPIFVAYGLVLVMILGGWFIATITPNGADFTTLVTVGALKGLTILLVTWAVGTAAHWYRTGDPSPMAPGLTPEEHAHLRAMLATQQAVPIVPVAPPAVPVRIVPPGT